MDISELENKLNQLEERYTEWSKPLDEFIRQNFPRTFNDGYKFADFQRDIEKIRNEQSSKFDLMKEVFEFFDQLCIDYLTASAEDRALIRLAVSERKGIKSTLLRYAYKCAEQIHTLAGRNFLLKGLAAISIEDCSRDFRDTLLALAELFVAAEASGFDPRPEFGAVATLSNSERPTGGETAMSKMLANFYSYAVLKERRAKSKRANA